MALSVLIYWTAVSMIPVYNKRVFAKGNYPYPVATATIQLAMVSLALGIVSIVKHLGLPGCPAWLDGSTR